MKKQSMATGGMIVDSGIFGYDDDEEQPVANNPEEQDGEYFAQAPSYSNM